MNLVTLNYNICMYSIWFEKSISGGIQARIIESEFEIQILRDGEVLLIIKALSFAFTVDIRTDIK